MQNAHCKMIRIILLICLIFIYKAKSLDPLSDEFIDHINSLNTTWKAGRNFPPNTPLSYIKSLLGARKGSAVLSLRSGLGNVKDLPENFDSREKWPNCPSLNEIRDQGRCGSCWAHGTVEMMTDRYCIASGGKKQFHFSAQDVLTCCSDCGDGCQGGATFNVLEYWKKVGIVSGGNYESGEGCRPYTIERCDHTDADPNNSCQPYDDTPLCVKTCQGNYSVQYEHDLKRAKEIYTIEGEENMMEEIYTRGPIVVAFMAYADFISYKGNGVYKHETGELLAGHAVKLIGWGVDKGVKYWLGANSWNTNFGDEGFFKFLRGSDHCGIESDVCAGIPDVDD